MTQETKSPRDRLDHQVDTGYINLVGSSECHIFITITFIFPICFNLPVVSSRLEAVESEVGVGMAEVYREDRVFNKS